MNSTDLVELNALANKAKEMYKLVKQTEEESAKRNEIWKFAIDSLKDYEDVCHTLVDIINNTREIFTPVFKGTKEKIDYNRVFTDGEEHPFATGSFEINDGKYCDGKYCLTIECENVKGRHIYNNFGYCREFLEDTSEWKAVGMSIRYIGGCYAEDFKSDLLTEKYTEERIANLAKIECPIDGVLRIKGFADNLRVRTEKIVDMFKATVKNITNDYKKRLQYIEDKSKPTEYVKVAV